MGSVTREKTLFESVPPCGWIAAGLWNSSCSGFSCPAFFFGFCTGMTLFSTVILSCRVDARSKIMRFFAGFECGRRVGLEKRDKTFEVVKVV